MMWLIFLALHLVGLVGYSLVLRKSLLTKSDPWVVATLMQTAIAVPLLFVLPFYPPNLAIYDAHAWTLIGLITLTVMWFHFSNVKALSHLQASTYSLIFNSRLIFATILGVVFLHEAAAPLQLFGGLLLLIAIVTATWRGNTKVTSAGLRWGVSAGLGISVLNMFELQLMQDYGYINFAIPAMLIPAAVMWLILFAQRKKVSLHYLRQPQTVLLMVLRAVSAYGFTLALNTGGLLSVTSYISSLSVVLIVLMGAWLLRERDHLGRKLIAAGIAAIGFTAILMVNLQK